MKRMKTNAQNQREENQNIKIIRQKKPKPNKESSISFYNQNTNVKRLKAKFAPRIRSLSPTKSLRKA